MSQNPSFISKSFFTIIFPNIFPKPKLYLYKFFTIIFPYIVSKPEQSRVSQLVYSRLLYYIPNQMHLLTLIPF